MKSCWQKNLELWAKTCPKQAVMLPYIDSKSLSECRTRLGEDNLKRSAATGGWYYHAQSGAEREAAKWFASLTLQKVPLVCVYGVGLGYYYDAIAPWLRKDRRRRLVFLEDNLAVIQLLLKTERGSRLLENPQVQLLYFHDLKDTEVFEAFYWNFALSRLAVTALHSYASHKGELLAQLRQKIAYDAAMKNALVDEYVRYGGRYYINFYQNMLCLPGAYQGERFFGQFCNVPAIICGAGPSLAKNLPLLGRLLDKAVVFAGGSALNVLNAAGLQPHFGAGIDPNPMQYERLAANQAHEVPFFYRNRLYYEALMKIHGPRLYIPGSGGYDTAAYFEKKLGIYREEFLDEGHNVVNFCVEIAHAMGLNPLIFIGMDLAFTGMQAYAPGVLADATVGKEAILDVDEEDDKAIVKEDIFGQPTYTLWKWVAEAEWIGAFAKSHPLSTLLNCTEGGLGFPGVSNLTLAEAAERHLQRNFELKNRIHGETQNSCMPQVTFAKISRAMKALQKSLQRCIEDFQLLLADAENAMLKLKADQAAPQQSGLAALAETELVEEPAYKYVLDIFNEVYARILSREVHELHVRRYSFRQRQIKKLALTIKKYAFLRDVAKVNVELIKYAFQHHKSSSPKEEVQKLSSNNKCTYRFSKKRLVMIDPALGLDVDEEFPPHLVPAKEPKDGQQLGEGYRVRLLYDQNWKPAECYVEHQGIPHGQSVLFYPDGSVKAECFYFEGSLHGPATFWSPQRQMLAQSWYLRGQQEGQSLWYYPDGSLYSSQRYRHNVWHGVQEFFYADGSLKTRMEYRQGKLVGDVFRY